MTQYPLVFKAQDVIAGRDFVASVRITGRITLSKEEDGSWGAYGVNPGGMAVNSDPDRAEGDARGGNPDSVAETGENIKIALRNFRETYRLILLDISADSPDFDAFRREVNAFFEDCDKVSLEEWTALHRRVREGGLELSGVGKMANPEIEIEISNLCQPRARLAPDLNADPQNEKLALAA